MVQFLQTHESIAIEVCFSSETLLKPIAKGAPLQRITRVRPLSLSMGYEKPNGRRSCRGLVVQGCLANTAGFFTPLAGYRSRGKLVDDN